MVGTETKDSRKTVKCEECQKEVKKHMKVFILIENYEIMDFGNFVGHYFCSGECKQKFREKLEKESFEKSRKVW